MTHICVSRLTIIGSDNGLSPGRRQAIIWTNAGILLIGPLGTNFSEILIEIYTFSLKKMHLKMLSGQWWPFCLSLNVLSADRSHRTCWYHDMEILSALQRHQPLADSQHKGSVIQSLCDFFIVNINKHYNKYMSGGQQIVMPLYSCDVTVIRF